MKAYPMVTILDQRRLKRILRRTIKKPVIEEIRKQLDKKIYEYLSQAGGNT